MAWDRPSKQAVAAASAELEAAETDAQLRSEWQYAVARLDTLHDEAWHIQTVQHERMTEIWLEVARLRHRIGEIAATGVSFDG